MQQVSGPLSLIRHSFEIRQADQQCLVFFIWFYIVWWCFFMDATQYVYVSEIWPNHLRSQGTALGVSFFYLASEVALVAAPVALNDIGWK